MSLAFIFVWGVLYIKYSLQIECNLNCNLCKSYSAQLLFLQIIFSPKCKVGLEMGSRAKLQKCKSAKSSGWLVMPKKQSAACIIRLLGQPLVQCSRQRHAVRLCPKQKGSVEGQLERLWVQPLPLSAWPHIVLWCGTHLDNGLGDKGGWAEPS